MAKLDVRAYLERIEYQGALKPDYATLEALHLAHATHIPFENLDILLGRPILLDLGSLQSKLVDGQRGGYCYEHNTLFAAVLREVGFSVTPLAARVRHRQTRLLPRTHMCLQVLVDGTDWIADVGFGGEGLLLPVPMTGQPAQQYRWAYRVVEESTGLRVLQSACGDSWIDLYAFSLEPQEHVDFEVANYYVSTHPSSTFVRTLTVQLPSPERRQILRDRELVVEMAESIETSAINSEQALLAILRKNFGLQFAADTRFKNVFDETTTYAGVAYK